MRTAANIDVKEKQKEYQDMTARLNVEAEKRKLARLLSKNGEQNQCQYPEKEDFSELKVQSSFGKVRSVLVRDESVSIIKGSGFHMVQSENDRSVTFEQESDLVKEEKNC